VAGHRVDLDAERGHGEGVDDIGGGRQDLDVRVERQIHDIVRRKQADAALLDLSISFSGTM
jgi:hypothetical protein